ncbi:MAG: hypothetical protein VW440_07665 [Bordetella sp.]
MPQSIYLRLTRVAAALAEERLSITPNSNEFILLGEIQWRLQASEEPLFVSEVIKWDHLFSPATLHKALKLLVDLDLVKQLKSSHDGRFRELRLTKKGGQVFVTLDKALLNVAAK